MRHRIVADIVAAYEQAEVERAAAAVQRASATRSGTRRARSDARRATRPMAIDVFAADEQEQQIGRRRPVRRPDQAGARVAVGLKGDVEVSLLFVDEVSMAELNERFLGESGPTDVLAFPIDDDPEPSGRSPDEGGTGPGWAHRRGPRSLSCSATSWSAPLSQHRNATEHGVAYEAEVELLVVHGLLHLLGMDHEEDDEAQLMETTPDAICFARFGSQSSYGRQDGQMWHPSPSAHTRRQSSERAISFLLVVVVLLLFVSSVLALAETAWSVRAGRRRSRWKTITIAGRASSSGSSSTPRRF